MTIPVRETVEVHHDNRPIWIALILGILLLSLVCCCGTGFTAWNYLNRETRPEGQPAYVPPPAAPVQPPAATEAPYVAPAGKCPANIESGQTVSVPAGCVALGDVEVNGKIYYDQGGSGQATVVVVIGQPVSVKAQWGAGIEEVIPFTSLTDLYKAYVADELATGCGDNAGCKSVRVVIFQDGNVTLDKTYTKGSTPAS